MSIDTETATIESVYKQPKDHADLKRYVDQYLSLSQTNADHIRRDRDYYDGDQISPEKRKVLAGRGQVVHHNNKIRLSVDGLLGLIDQSESDPEAYPRNEVGQDAADAVTKTLRYLSDKTNYSRVRMAVSQNFLIEGTGAVVLEFNRTQIDVTPILWEDLVYDPLARDHWFADAKFMGIAKLLDAADVAALYPEAYDALDHPVGDFNIFFDDERKDKWWSTAKRDRLRVVDLYYEVGFEWHRAIFCDTGMLYAGPCDYHDDDGNTFCPIRPYRARSSATATAMASCGTWCRSKIHSTWLRQSFSIASTRDRSSRPICMRQQRTLRLLDARPQSRMACCLTASPRSTK